MLRHLGIDYSGAVSNDPAYAERQDLNFPDISKCQDGIRWQVFFPQCWDGVNLDSADHKSHMAYPVDNYNGGTCPPSHPVHTVAIFYEQIMPVSQYPYWGQGAYALSTGDDLGLTYHADFLMGWNSSVLQDAVDNCHNMNGDIYACQVLLPYINTDAASACTLDSDVQIVNENVGANGAEIPAIPGCNPVRSNFSQPASCASSPTPGFVQATETLTPGWTDIGCIAEGTNGRALTAASTKAPNMTANVCIGYCGSQGFTYAGVEYGDVCRYYLVPIPVIDIIYNRNATVVTRSPTVLPLPPSTGTSATCPALATVSLFYPEWSLTKLTVAVISYLRDVRWTPAP